jgi:TPR repeat protein
MRPTLAAAALALLAALSAAPPAARAGDADDIFATCNNARAGTQTRLAACAAAVVGRPHDMALRLAHAEALYRAGEDAAAAEAYEPVAEAGNARAQTALGTIYMRGRGGAKPDRERALYWYEKAASQGHVYAQSVAGFLYFNGVNDKRDFARAAAWMKKAAFAGVGDAQFGLGTLYAQDAGVTADPVEALMWFNVAATKLPPGLERRTLLRYRASVAAKLSADQIDEAVRLAAEWRALEGR